MRNQRTFKVLGMSSSHATPQGEPQLSDSGVHILYTARVRRVVNEAHMSSAWQSSFAGRDAAAAQSSYRSLPLKWSVAAASIVSCSSCIAPCLEVSDTNTTARLDLLTAVAVPLSAATHDPFMLQHADHCPQTKPDMLLPTMSGPLTASDTYALIR